MYPKRILIALLIPAAILEASLLGGCGEDPLGPDNRMALLAFGQCRDDQALQLTDNAIERGNERNVLRALMLKAAILRDRGDTAAAEALHPRITEAWETAKRRTLSPERRERDIQLFIDVARDERIARGLAADCDDGPPLPAKP
ncbi:MAG: hypothetical protein WBG92_13620 [Thiohalocapsa sp.]